MKLEDALLQFLLLAILMDSFDTSYDYYDENDYFISEIDGQHEETPDQSFYSVRVENDPEPAGDEIFAGHVFNLFRRGVDAGAGDPWKTLEQNNRLIIIKGAEFRRKINEGLLATNHPTNKQFWQFNNSDFHFFGAPITSDLQIYLLVKETVPYSRDLRLDSIKLGRCWSGPPAGKITGQKGVETLYNATDDELDRWLNSSTSNAMLENDRLCNELAMRADLMNFRFGNSNYSLFKSVLPTDGKSEAAPSYLYLRGRHQTADERNSYSFYTILINDIWLIASNWRVNFTALRNYRIDANGKPFPIRGNNDTCQTGIQIERDALGYVHYVDKISLRADRLRLLYAARDGEELIVPGGDVCVKFCIVNPLFHSATSDSFKTEPVVRCQYPGSQRVDQSVWRNLVVKLQSNPEVLSELVKLAHYGLVQGGISDEGSALMNNIKAEADDKSEQRMCRPLEPRYEPIGFYHPRRGQRNLYYRFEVIPIGSNRCCCF